MIVFMTLHTWLKNFALKPMIISFFSKFVDNFCTKTFRPKRNFVKSIPGVKDIFGVEEFRNKCKIFFTET
jgi:hypothetical protein